MSERVLVKQLDVNTLIEEGYGTEDQLLVSNFWIDDEDDLEKLRNSGVKYCMVERNSDSDSFDTKKNREKQEPVETEGMPADEVLNDELEHLPDYIEQTEAVYEETLETLKDVFPSSENNTFKPQKIGELKSYVERIADFTKESPASISILTQLKNYDQETFSHSINVAILCLNYGRYREFDRDELINLGYGALVHDIGKTQLPHDLIRKEDELTPDEWKRLKEHPEIGRDILRGQNADPVVQSIALEHHETPDGSGYPNGRESVHPFSRIVSVIDVYEALTAPRAYHDPVNPLRAYNTLKEMFYEFDSTRRIVRGLIRCLGLFPVGSLVTLTNDDIGVVYENNTDYPKSPTIKVIEKGDGADLDKPYEVDLEAIRHQKQIIRGRIYDEEVTVDRVMDLSQIPKMRSIITNFFKDIAA